MAPRNEAALALEGGRPVRARPLPYARQSIDESDVAQVLGVLRSDWLTTGPAVAAFEGALADYVGCEHAVAVNSGTAALHSMLAALGIGPGDEVIVPAMTFVATANAAVFLGATPVFADVREETLLMDPISVARCIRPQTRAIIAVDYAGQPADYPALRQLGERSGVTVLADACHSLGGALAKVRCGKLAMMNAFSFHPVKHITTAEGGMVTTDDAALAQRLRRFRNHGIATDARERETRGTWRYEMQELGFNYRINDMQCALGQSQLGKLDQWISRRGQIARAYDAALRELPELRPLALRNDVQHAYHLYVVRLDLDRLTQDRDGVFRALRAEGIGVNVHYFPAHLHPFYRQRFATHAGLCPVAERVFREIVTLPLFPAMTDEDVSDVIIALHKVIGAYRK